MKCALCSVKGTECRVECVECGVSGAVYSVQCVQSGAVYSVQCVQSGVWNICSSSLTRELLLQK